jgi:hypothetical protein
MEAAVILAVEEGTISGERPAVREWAVLEWACLVAPELGAVNAGAEVTEMDRIGTVVTGMDAIGAVVTGTVAIGMAIGTITGTATIM